MLILLNGPPGVGKSTLAQRYVDDHPRALDLEIDLVRSLLGQWRAEALRRFLDRAELGPPPSRFDAAELVERSGGVGILGEQYDALVALVATRPDAVIIETRSGRAEASYTELLRSLG